MPSKHIKRASKDHNNEAKVKAKESDYLFAIRKGLVLQKLNKINSQGNAYDAFFTATKIN